jgi:hypothetical protein
MKRIYALAACTLAASLLPGCTTMKSAATGLYEGFFPGANFSPDKYDPIAFDYAVSPSAADQNRHKKFQFNAVYFGVANNVGKNEISSQHINITLCEDASRQLCTSKIIVHDLDAKEVTSIPRGAPVTFYGMVADIQGVAYGDITVANQAGSLNGIFLLKAHEILPR